LFLLHLTAERKMKRLKGKNKYLVLLFSLVVLFAGCQPEAKETPTKGTLKCYADESLYRIVVSLRDSFVTKYPDAKIELGKLKAREGIVKVLNGENTMFISSRELNKEETEFIHKTNINVVAIKFCYDALTVIVDSNHALSRMTTTELKQILLGNSKQYKVFIPDQNTGVFENLKMDLLENKMPAAAKIVNGEEEVVNSIRKNKNSIGIVGLNIAKSAKGIKIVRIGTDERSVTGGVYYKPIAGYLSNGEYPLIRTCYIFLNEIGILLGNGFSTYITNHDGQKIILDYDLGPATVPIRYKQMTRLK
jgi:phosphate transport system substrate-binding protein